MSDTIASNPKMNKQSIKNEILEQLLSFAQYPSTDSTPNHENRKMGRAHKTMI